LFLKSSLEKATGAWGVQIERVEVKDVRVPENLQRAMAAEAEAAREARAKVIAAQGEHKASRALKHAAEVIIDNPVALQVFVIFMQFIILQLRYLQILSSIATENNSTIVFTVPIHIISNMLNMAKPGNQMIGPVRRNAMLFYLAIF
jgi:erythrocyte band 7 integral membrane protein